MKPSSVRRSLLLAALSTPVVTVFASVKSTGPDFDSVKNSLAELERSSRGRLGVAIIDTATGARDGYRAGERFAFCSTFKAILASAVLARSASDPGLLDRTIVYTKSDMVSYSPITERHIGVGMRVSELCAAALQYSDNSAANQLLRIVGGPAGVTAFARSVGDTTFRLDRIETALNTAIPGDPRDTSTPMAMATTLERLALGDALTAPARQQLIDWMRGNTTGAKRIRAGVPSDWQVADKTGTGDYGTTNDIGIVWPPGRPPIVITIYFTQSAQDAKARDDVIASAARIVAKAFE